MNEYVGFVGEPLEIIFKTNIFVDESMAVDVDHDYQMTIFNENGEVALELYPDIGLGIMIDQKLKVELSAYIGDCSVLDPGRYKYEISIYNRARRMVFSSSGEIIITKKQEGQNSFRPPVKPWDLLNPGKDRSSREERKRRFDICKSCPQLSFGICKECGCAMALKTSLKDAFCPLHKW